MLLAIDVGNTHIVLGCINDKLEVTQTMQMETKIQSTSHEYAVLMKEIFSLEKINPHKFAGVIISSVVPQINVVLTKAVLLVTGVEPFILGAGVKTGLNIRMDDPGTIAGDMVATAVAAKEEYPLPCIIIDMGTATTVTVVDKTGTYIGGCILPGSGIALDALTAKTSLLPSIDFVAPKKVIGTNTIDAMKGGIIFGSSGALDGIIDRFADELGEVGSIVATGGLGRIIAPHCRHEIIVDNRLLLKGLGYIFAKNQEAEKKPARTGGRKKAKAAESSK